MNEQVVTHLARCAYDAYGHSTGWKNFQGNPMPEWADLGESVQHAWRAAAYEVARVAGAEIVQCAKDWLFPPKAAE